MQQAPMSKSPPTIKISLSAAEAIQLREAAIRHKTSPAALAQLGMRQLLAQIRQGAAPFIQPSTDECGLIPESCEHGTEALTVPITHLK